MATGTDGEAHSPLTHFPQLRKLMLGLGLRGFLRLT